MFNHLEIRLINIQRQSLIQENNFLKSEIAKLNSIISAKNEEINTFSAKEIHVKNSLSQYEDRLNSKNKDIELLKNELFKSQEGLKIFEDNLNNSLKTNESYKAKFKQFEETIAQKDIEYLNLFKNFDNLQSKMNSVQTENLNLKNEMFSYKLQESELKNESSLLTNEKSKIQQNLMFEISNKDAEIQNLSQRLKLLEEEKIQIQQVANQKLYEVESINNNLNFQLSQEKHKLNDVQMQIDNKNTHFDAALQNMTDMKNELYLKEKEINLLKEMLADKEKEIQRVFELRQKLSKYTDLENNIIKTLSRGSKHQEGGSNTNNYYEDFVKLKVIHDDLRAEYEEVKKTFSYYKDKILDYENQREKSERLEIMLQLVHEEVRGLQLKLEECNNQFESEKNQTLSLEAFTKKLSLQVSKFS